MGSHHWRRDAKTRERRLLLRRRFETPEQRQGFIQDFILGVGGIELRDTSLVSEDLKGRGMLPKKLYRFKGSKHTLDAFKCNMCLHVATWFFEGGGGGLSRGDSPLSPSCMKP